ncbi:mediator of RNA polymerase II transcription subunit 17 [Parastagonospora nodorum]|uniref:Mediator of RNA polymerase II transcription subunit 17 n=1 Tax=Phaeosphaeria nodorum (strain SN15 / ATCC MYA-4574 / FGSC 10173) TaxID=321614 RepID=A0A7U2ESV8_PHANO|nr:mediator of RNA polymerase II transcription subunit 17 [Parastagonospora nodorum]QRC92423.1 mediator of RNA polymerase II transcription subunit 17 [Parastagonospora nodorum SN15]KAH3925177.1 mediator of RNA polymerase II transcription subunit 17 [Parastagonospora nodorum]KAH3954499.1 mediator of RNA polymerase II transcription subunit 17 [Parastagonospora nodorum]KAH3963780.1 mediator of RNA polymerase II transcription subunit 17 [Parastagonospora nodorum]
MSGYESLADVTLRPWPAAKKEELSPQDLLLQIEQLGTERGHLRDVTEKSLQEDMAAGKGASEEAAGSLEQKKKKKDATSREERLQEVLKAQHEMCMHMEWAKFAATNTVDLISLILSADPNRRSLANFSHSMQMQGLQQGLPFGAFGLGKESHVHHDRKHDEQDVLKEYAHRQELVSKGARMEALDRATDDILKAARKLEKEVRRETKYWQEIVSISDKGWPIQRVRQDMRNVPFAVRYGHPEASNHFKARGLAPLRMDKDGSIILDPALASKPKSLRVRIRQDGNVTGTSHLPTAVGESDTTIEKTIQRTRNSLFEEELFHEMSLEARQLMAHGVDYRDSIIHIDASGSAGQQRSMTLLIDCIPLEGPNPASQEHANDWLAQNIVEGLRLLLTHEQSMRLYRRTQVPPPLTGQKREKQSPSLLRTLLAIFHHLQGVDSLYGYLNTVAETLKNAGLPIELDTTREVSWARLANTLRSSPKKGISAADQLLDIFSKPFDGRATLTLPALGGTPSESITLSTRTVIGQPTFGSEHRLTLPSTLAADLGLFPQHKFSSVEETVSYLDWVLSLNIAHRQLKNHFSTRAAIKGDDARVTIRGKNTKKTAIADSDILIQMQDGKLRATATIAESEEGAEEAEQSYTWIGKEASMSLTERIKSWVG